MGQHYVKFDLVGDPAIDPLQPEALVYERRETARSSSSRSNGCGSARKRRQHRRSSARTCSTGPAPNRYGIEPGFYERHYWLYKSNPLGAFSDWNPTVSCRGTGDNGG